jgi:hypothetical protein
MGADPLNSKCGAHPREQTILSKPVGLPKKSKSGSGWQFGGIRWQPAGVQAI